MISTSSRPIVFHGGGDQVRQPLHVMQISLHQRGGIRTDAVQFVAQRLRFRRRGTVVDHQARPFPVQPAADRRADPLRPAGNQYDFALHVFSITLELPESITLAMSPLPAPDPAALEYSEKTAALIQS